MGERARGVVLYACAVVLLAAGLTWWLRAAPHVDPDPRIALWSQNAKDLLPDVEEQEDARTVALSPDRDHVVLAEVGSGEYTVTVICVAGSDSQVRISLGDASTDSGRGVDCSSSGPRVTFRVS